MSQPSIVDVSNDSNCVDDDEEEEEEEDEEGGVTAVGEVGELEGGEAGDDGLMDG